jgi:hypothetical protein
MQPNPFGLAYSQSPVDIPEPLGTPPNGLRWTATVILVATMTLGLLNAHAMRGWAYQLPANAVSTRAIAAAEGWYDAVDRIRLNTPVESMRVRWQALKAPVNSTNSPE